jgi:8-oxo-dGTP pyrophosphatase MutT (NUDIX family)
MSFVRKEYDKGVVVIAYTGRDVDRQYLLLRRIHPWRGWGLLKGGCEGNSERFTVKKEVKEEAQLKEYLDYREDCIQRIQNLRVKYKRPRRQKNIIPKSIGQDLQVFVLKVRNESKDRVHVDYEENDDYCWVGLERAKEMLRHKNYKIALEKADEFIREMERNRFLPKL